MRLPWASLTKPESIGCCTSACTSVTSPLATARTRIVDAICFCLPSTMLPSAAAAADGDFDFFGRAVDLAVGLDQRDDLAGLRHFQAIGDHGRRAGRNLVARRKRERIFRDRDRDRGHVR